MHQSQSPARGDIALREGLRTIFPVGAHPRRGYLVHSRRLDDKYALSSTVTQSLYWTGSPWPKGMVATIRAFGEGWSLQLPGCRRQSRDFPSGARRRIARGGARQNECTCDRTADCRFRFRERRCSQTIAGCWRRDSAGSWTGTDCTTYGIGRIHDHPDIRRVGAGRARRTGRRQHLPDSRSRITRRAFQVRRPLDSPSSDSCDLGCGVRRLLGLVRNASCPGTGPRGCLGLLQRHTWSLGTRGHLSPIPHRYGRPPRKISVAWCTVGTRRVDGGGTSRLGRFRDLRVGHPAAAVQSDQSLHVRSYRERPSVGLHAGGVWSRQHGLGWTPV